MNLALTALLEVNVSSTGRTIRYYFYNIF